MLLNTRRIASMQMKLVLTTNPMMTKIELFHL